MFHIPAAGIPELFFEEQHWMKEGLASTDLHVLIFKSTNV